MEQKQDILNRQEYINQLIKLVNCLSEKHTSSCFAIDGQWGAGKTYVLDMFEKQVEKIQLEETANDKYFVFNYNCWKYDYYEEPSIAIVSAMLDKLEKEEKLFGEKTDAFLKSSWGKAKEIIAEIAGEFSKNKIGVNLVEIAKDIKEDVGEKKKEKYKFDEMFSFRKTLTDARKKLSELAEYKSIIFIVDELDRCLPSYSIKVMERLHHLFDGINNITVILSVDSTQLKYSIKQIYGENIEVDKYLKKFIDFTLTLSNGKLSEDFEDKYKEYFNNFSCLNEIDKQFFRELFLNIFSGIDIRTQEKLMAKAKLIHEILCNNQELNPALLCFEIMWVVFSYRRYTDNLYWIPKINQAIYSGLKEAIGENLEKYLKDTEKSVGSNKIVEDPINDKRFRILNDVLKDNTFWIFANLYDPAYGNKCDTYLNENADSLQIETKMAKEFEAIAKIMK